MGRFWTFVLFEDRVPVLSLGEEMKFRSLTVAFWGSISMVIEKGKSTIPMLISNRVPLSLVIDCS